MSRFQSAILRTLTPYTPGEQPRDMQYTKLNTNESPFPPSPKALAAAAEAAKALQLYSDPTCRALVEKLAEIYGVAPDEVIVTNGSDEVLDFAFQAFCDKQTSALFADITYGFYPVFAARNGIPYETVALRDDFSIDITDYFGAGKTIFIANPNAPTGLALSREQIEQIVMHNPDNVVVVDEAYVDFGGESCVPLVKKYDNLLVTQTFSKSRSLAGGRLGFGIGCKSLIADLQTIRYSTNPYNVNSMTLAAGLGTLADEKYTQENCQTIIENRAWTTAELQKRGFELTDSKTNFIFAKHPSVSGETIYTELKARGVLVRHFGAERICDYNRITIGSMEQMKILVQTLSTILEELT
ncbi:MAG: histidinol-phosphate transaminase [Clostridia bacterium]|nr:histidinol-phosphate transaminase [Clostridia bacterium]